MAQIRSNRLLPIFAGVALLVLAIVVMKTAFFDGDGPTVTVYEPQTELPALGQEPDADTPADTIRALRGEIQRQNELLASVQDQNQRLVNENQDLRKSEARIRGDLRQEMDERFHAQQSANDSSMHRGLERLEQQFSELQGVVGRQAAPTSPQDTDSPYSDLPVGVGLNALLGRNYTWVTPLDAAPGETADGERPGLVPVALQSQIEGRQATQRSPAQQIVDPPVPYFTIPNLATLAVSTAFTALIGRVPIDGQVRDPVPFRVLVGRENLAASGLRVPNDIIAMVFEGVGVGDWTLACVEGSLHTATFIFEDGRIRTVSTLQSDNSNPGLRQERLGYIADRFGTPCISGERVSNAPTYLATTVALNSAAAAARAAAASETTQIVGASTGTVTSAVTGDRTQYVIGETIADGVSTVEEFLAKRLASQFDAVFVPAGKELALMIQKEISIDYDPNGRLLDYARSSEGGRRRGLD